MIRVGDTVNVQSSQLRQHIRKVAKIIAYCCTSMVACPKLHRHLGVRMTPSMRTTNQRLNTQGQFTV